MVDEDEYRDKYFEEKFKVLETSARDNRENQIKIFERLDEIGKDVSALKVKSGLWGGMSGAMSTIAVFAMVWLKEMFTGKS